MTTWRSASKAATPVTSATRAPLSAGKSDAELAAQLSSRVTRAVMPDFFFRERGGG